MNTLRRKTRQQDNALFSLRGVMLDPARLTERHEFYFDLLPQLAEWGYNTLWWHFNDDEGFALKLASHPELASPFAFSRAETRRLVQGAAKAGIDIVPEVESLGHSLSITGLPRYAHLFNGQPRGHNAICPSHPETLPLLADVIREVAALFPSPYLHAGLDESVIAGCPRCERRGRGKPSWWVFAEHVKAIHRIVTSCGKRMIMWADSVEKHPELLGVLPKDIVLAHWHYKEVPAHKITPSVKAGFTVICVPAISGQILQPDAAAVQNVDDMVALAQRLPRRRCPGVVACWWESFRNLRDAYPLAAAYAGQAMTTGTASERIAFTQRFLRSHFGVVDAAAARALWRMHELPLGRGELHALYPASMVDLHSALTLTANAGFAGKAADAATSVQALQNARRKVTRNRSVYDAYLLAARITATAYANGLRFAESVRIQQRAAAYTWGKAPRDEVHNLLRQAVEPLDSARADVATVAADASREWDRTRHRNDLKKDNSSPRLRQRSSRTILPILLQSDRFCRQWLRQYRTMIAVYARGGPFPGGI